MEFSIYNFLKEKEIQIFEFKTICFMNEKKTLTLALYIDDSLILKKKKKTELK